jgi:hypothetical protein
VACWLSWRGGGWGARSEVWPPLSTSREVLSL